MCRSTDYHRFSPVNRDPLRIRSFSVWFSGLEPAPERPLPQSLTLVYLPRISGAALEIAGSKIRPDAAAFVSLHRGVGVAGSGGGEGVWFGSRERVVVGEGARFEVFLGEEKVLRGFFRRGGEGEGEREWRLELSCAMGREIAGVSAAEVRVGVSAEGRVAVSERVAMAAVAARRRRFEGLEEIPEEREEEVEERGCNCDRDCDVGSDGRDLRMEMDGEDDEMDMEGVGWAVDVGIWVVCLGVGLLVSKASSKTLRRRRIL